MSDGSCFSCLDSEDNQRVIVGSKKVLKASDAELLFDLVRILCCLHVTSDIHKLLHMEKIQLNCLELSFSEHMFVLPIVVFACVPYVLDGSPVCSN